MRRYVLSDFQFATRIRVANTNLLATLVAAFAGLIAVLTLFGVVNLGLGLALIATSVALMAPIYQGRSTQFIASGLLCSTARSLICSFKEPNLERFVANDCKRRASQSRRLFAPGRRFRGKANCFAAEDRRGLIVIRFQAKRPPQLLFDDEKERFMATAQWIERLLEITSREGAKLRIIHSRDETLPRSGIRSHLVASFSGHDREFIGGIEGDLIRTMASNLEIASFKVLNRQEIALFCSEHFFEEGDSRGIRYRINAIVVRGGRYQLWGVTDFGRFSGGFGEIFSLFAKISSIRALIIELSSVNQQRYAASIRARRSRIDAKVLWRNSKGFSRSMALIKSARALEEAEADLSNEVLGANFAFYLVANSSFETNVSVSAKADCSIRLHGFAGTLRETWEHINPVAV
ncbi:MAG: hypothetical protein M0Z45_10535 [Actinomycetota bacterium]|nr:hypothetical protein [Actinomycetota bacterium]